jgi:hypothetical protein
MPAYDMQDRQPLAGLPHVLASTTRTLRSRSVEEPAETNTDGSIRLHAGNEVESIVDALVDRLADRVVAAIAARLGDGPDHEDEWLDSRAAAD